LGLHIRCVTVWQYEYAHNDLELHQQIGENVLRWQRVTESFELGYEVQVAKYYKDLSTYFHSEK
jgi:hypothetical protein